MGNQGVRGPGGGRVRLEAVLVGGRWTTSEPAFERFVAATTPVASVTSAPPPPTPASRRRRADAANRELRDGGW